MCADSEVAVPISVLKEAYNCLCNYSLKLEFYFVGKEKSPEEEQEVENAIQLLQDYMSNGEACVPIRK